jgi:flavin-dependent dehydrogenase
MEIPIELPYHKGRNYGYAIDRARFDKALWDHALRLETVSGIQRFRVNHLLWDEQGESVIGVTGLTSTGAKPLVTTESAWWGGGWTF